MLLHHCLNIACLLSLFKYHILGSNVPIHSNLALNPQKYLQGLDMISVGQENLLIIFRSKGIYSKTNNKIPVNLLKLCKKQEFGQVCKLVI